MERLTGLDAAFLYLETDVGHMHIALVTIYDVSTMPGGYKFETIRDHIVNRLHVVAPFRRRLVEVPFQFHHPVWVEDPDFDVDDHVRRITCPAPGGRRELAEVAAQIASVQLNRDRPLWEAWVIEGLKQDRIAVVIKVHHSAVDGAGGADIMTTLFDLSPELPPAEPVDIEGERVPNELELMSYAAISKFRRAYDFVPLISRTVGNVATLVGNIRDEAANHGAVPLTAPRTPFNQSIGPDRAVAFARIPLDDTKRIKNALGVKVNDVVLAVCSGTLRRYLLDRDALPEESLLAVCPVSVRDGGESSGNKVSAMFASLATDEADPGARLQTIVQSTQGAKEDHDAIGATTLTDWAEWAAPRTFALASRVYSSLHLANQHRPIHNLVISNVPGPPFPLYLAGAELVAAYPMGPILEGGGLNITMLSYRDHVDIGFMADADLVPDVWKLADDVAIAFEELKQYAGLTDPTIVKSAAPVTRTVKRSGPGAGAARPAGKSAPTEQPAAPASEPAAAEPAAEPAPAKPSPAKKAPAKPASAKKRKKKTAAAKQGKASAG